MRTRCIYEKKSVIKVVTKWLFKYHFSFFIGKLFPLIYTCYCHLLYNLTLLNKREMIFEQPFLTTLVTTLSLILLLYFYSLSSFFSLYCYCSTTREKKDCHPKLFKIGCQNIIPLNKIQCHSFRFSTFYF